MKILEALCALLYAVIIALVIWAVMFESEACAAPPIPPTMTTSWGEVVEVRVTDFGPEARKSESHKWVPCVVLDRVGGGYYLACVGVGSFRLEGEEDDQQEL